MPKPNHPLPACPPAHRFACVRRSHAYAVAPGVLFEAAHAALRQLAPEALHAKPEAGTLHAVCKVGPFRDDFHVVIAPDDASEAGAWLHLRSMSRVGRFDLFVNRVRVARFRRHLAHALCGAMAAPSGVS